MLSLSIDFSDVLRVARNLGAAQDQVPFAMSLALNRATENTRQLLIRQTWPNSGIKQRNASFMRASLTSREARATKYFLSTEIYDRLNRGHLLMHAKGGIRTPHGGGTLAVPVDLPRGARGVPQRLRPKNLRNAVRIKDRLYTRDRKGRLKLVYVLKPTTRIPRRVPFHEDYRRSMSVELHKELPRAIAQAMATRRAR